MNKRLLACALIVIVTMAVAIPLLAVSFGDAKRKVAEERLSAGGCFAAQTSTEEFSSWLEWQNDLWCFALGWHSASWGHTGTYSGPGVRYISWDSSYHHEKIQPPPQEEPVRQ